MFRVTIKGEKNLDHLDVNASAILLNSVSSEISLYHRSWQLLEVLEYGCLFHGHIIQNGAGHYLLL